MQFKILVWFVLLSSVSTFCFIILCSFYPLFRQDKFIIDYVHAELGQSLSDFGKAVKLLGASEGNALGKAFSELGMKSEILSVKLQKEVILTFCCWTTFYWLFICLHDGIYILLTD